MSGVQMLNIESINPIGISEKHVSLKVCVTSTFSTNQIRYR
jgi:hypothetical protein